MDESLRETGRGGLAATEDEENLRQGCGRACETNFPQ